MLNKFKYIMPLLYNELELGAREDMKMTVRELIAELLEYDMESEIEIVGNHGNDYEVFSDFSIDEDYQITGKNRISINFQTEGVAFIDEDRLEKLEELEDEQNA